MDLHSLSFKKKKKLPAALFLSKSQAHAVQQKLTVVTVCPQQSWIQIEIEIASLNPPTHTHRHTRCLEKTKQTCKITFLVSMDRYRLVSRWSSYTVTRGDMSCIHKV